MKYHLKIKLPKTKEFVGNYIIYIGHINNIILPIYENNLNFYKEIIDFYKGIQIINDMFGSILIDICKINKTNFYSFPVDLDNIKTLHNILINHPKQNFLMLTNFKSWPRIKATFKIYEIYNQPNIWFIHSKKRKNDIS